jgi:hypothetical protein
VGHRKKEHTKMSKFAKFGCEMLYNVENIALQSLQILYTFVCCVRKLLPFRPKCGRNVVGISARNTKIYKTCELRKAIFSAFYNISQPNFANLLILVCSF